MYLRRHRCRSLFASCAILCALTVMALPGREAAAQTRHRLGVAGKQAPSWPQVEWLNLPTEIPRLDISDLRGQVVYLFFFQSWCPGCHAHGFPTLQALEQRYRDNDQVFFVAVQTVFEGFGTNTKERAIQDLEDYDLAIPLAHDAGEDGPSAFMRSYRTGGTPWTVIIDRRGVVRWNGFQIDEERGTKMIESLLDG